MQKEGNLDNAKVLPVSKPLIPRCEVDPCFPYPSSGRDTEVRDTATNVAALLPVRGGLKTVLASEWGSPEKVLDPMKSGRVSFPGCRKLPIKTVTYGGKRDSRRTHMFG